MLTYFIISRPHNYVYNNSAVVPILFYAPDLYNMISYSLHYSVIEFKNIRENESTHNIKEQIKKTISHSLEC